MAKEFPHVRMLGIDRPDGSITSLICDDVPSNCRFESRPDYQFLEEERNKDRFDVIHMRFVAGGVSVYFINHYATHLCYIVYSILQDFG
jgi:hypothetical protein